MPRIIKLSEIGDYSEKQISKLLKATVFEANKRLQMKSPVDTGRFRASWQISQNANSEGYKPDGKYGKSIYVNRTNYSVETAGNLYRLLNNLPYALPLETGAPGSGSRQVTRYNPKREVTTWASPGLGSSIQTSGPGWIRNTSKDLKQYVLRQARIIGRTS